LRVLCAKVGFHCSILLEIFVDIAQRPCRKIGIGGVVTHSPPSRPGEFHPEPLTEPDLNLSAYPARATHGRLPSSPNIEFLRLPVELGSVRVTCSLCSSEITPDQRSYGAVRPWRAHWYFRPHGASACAFSLTIANQVLKFRTKAQTRVTPPVHRTSHGQ